MSLCFSDQVVDSDRPEGSKFRLTGKGVDQEPKGIFRINENTGSVSVTRNLDRETIATYQVSTPTPTQCLPHMQRCAFQRLLPSHWAHHFCASSNPGLCGFKCVSVEAKWHWTLTQQQWGPLSHQQSPPGLRETLGTKNQEEGPWGDLRGGQKPYINIGFPETSLVMKSCKKYKTLDLIILLLESHLKEIGRNLVRFLYTMMI